MAKSRKRSARSVPRRHSPAKAPTTAALPASLPLPARSEPLSLSTVTTTALAPTVPARVPKKRDRSVLPSNSLVRTKVLAIIAMRIQGKNTAEIAAELGIKERSVNQYMFLAGKNGWLKKKAVDPNDRLQFELAQKVVRNLDEMLDSTDEERRDLATLKTAEGMTFKQFGEQAQQPQQMTVIGVRIEMPPALEGAAAVTIRPETTGGTPRWAEGEVVDEQPQRP